jgi:hypothetical protein
MTRKDYIALANALKDAKPDTFHDPVKIWGIAVANIADVLKADNSNFDRARFLTACGVDQ